MAKKKYIETPEKMWELFEEYRTATKRNPFLLHDFVGKDGESVRRERERCLTMEGFEEYVAEKGLNQELSHYFSNKEERYKEYVAICTRVKRAIRRDQIEGGMSGIYNSSITQRLNGLVDKKETEIKGGLNIPPESTDIGERK
jgi:hypothetical protein